jgi:cyanophycinase
VNQTSIHAEQIGGHLLIIGGAEDKYNERRILRKFVSLAGEKDAKILLVPIASDFPEFASDVYSQVFRKMGLENGSVRTLRATSRQEILDANADEMLDGVTGVFLSGGDQMRLASILGGTPFAEKLMQMVRNTTLVLAGSSAGAAGMSNSMIVRGDGVPAPHRKAIALSPGLGVLHNIIIDQHFSERGRISRLITAVSYNPSNLGVGIDENTSVILDNEGILEVFGEGTVTIVDGSNITYNDIAEVEESLPFSVTGLHIHILREGMQYDFTNRKCVAITSEFLLPEI